MRKQRVEASRRFAGPWWVTVAVLDIEAGELVRPVLEELRARVSRTTSIVRTVEVHCGRLERGSDTAALPVHWRDSSHARAFPEMRGVIQLVEIGRNETEIRFVGQYVAPLGALGTIGDAIAGHRLAQRTVEDVVERLADRLEAAVSLHIGTEPEGGTR